MSATLPNAIPAEAAADRLAELAERTAQDKARLLVTRHGKPVAALVPIEDLEALEAQEDEQDSRLANEAIARWEAEGRPLGATLEQWAARWGITFDPNTA